MSVSSNPLTHQAVNSSNKEFSNNSLANADGKSWFICHKLQPEAKMRIICFPWAGGSPRAMASFFDLFPENIEFWAFELPGRGTKIDHELVGRFEDIVKRAHEEIKISQFAKSPIPYIIFGHSLGGKIAFEITKRLFNSRNILPKGVNQPIGLIIGGLKSPDLFKHDVSNYMSHLSETDFIERLRKLGGIQESYFNNPDLLEYMLPILRFDIRLSEDYRYIPAREKLPIPVIIMGGNKDQFPESMLTGWSNITSRSCKTFIYNGNHFFLVQDEVKDMVKSDFLRECENICEKPISHIIHHSRSTSDFQAKFSLLSLTATQIESTPPSPINSPRSNIVLGTKSLLLQSDKSMSMSDFSSIQFSINDAIPFSDSSAYNTESSVSSALSSPFKSRSDTDDSQSDKIYNLPDDTERLLFV